MTAPNIIASARGLSKAFGQTQVLHGIDFDIPAGRIYGLVGQNGAGKTTTLNALLGLTASEGDVEILGKNPFQHRAKLMNDVAFVADVASLPRFLKVRELLDLMTDLHPSFDRDKAVGFLDGTDVKSGAKIKHLSKGMLAQLHLAVVMAIDAKLLILDEPTLGLDIIYRKRFYRRLLEDYMTEDRTVLITTHQVDEIEFLLSDIIFLNNGKVMLDTSVDEISGRFAQVSVAKDMLDDAKNLNPIYSETRFDHTVMVFDGVPVETLGPLGEISTPSLSDLFVALMQSKPTTFGEV